MLEPFGLLSGSSTQMMDSTGNIAAGYKVTFLPARPLLVHKLDVKLKGVAVDGHPFEGCRAIGGRAMLTESHIKRCCLCLPVQVHLIFQAFAGINDSPIVNVVKG